MKHLLTLLTLFILSLNGWAEDAKTQAQGEPEFMKYTRPGEGHKLLGDMVGNWKYTSTWWASSDAKPEKSEGTATTKWIMDGRFIQMDVTGKAMGQHFNGMAIMGYDSFRGIYQSMWIDSMVTGMMTSTGTYNAKTKTLTETGMGSDPFTGIKEKKYRNETKMKNKNSYVFTMYTTDAKGKEFKSGEMVYTRVK